MVDLHDRVRLEDIELHSHAAGRVCARVALRWSGGELYEHTAEGEDSEHGRLRTAAEAAARALVDATLERIRLDVLAVKSLETFDTVLVVVSLSSTVGDLTERLVGASLLRARDPAHGAVLAVLDATNRLVSKVMQNSS